jgi:NAD(P)-dependent dehydrogenase (short-subunit alcohol dehydrogenase family)
MKLAGKKALITGGNSGIGLATARLFVAEGAEVAITGRDQKTLDEAVAELGSKAYGYRADVTVGEDRKKLFADLSKDFRKLDIVFANAGISGRTPTGSTDEAIFGKVVHTNLTGAFFTVNSAAPLLNDNGSIIFNGSVHNYLGQPGVAAYAATKGGLDGAIYRRRPCAAQDSRKRRGPGGDETPLLEARAARPCHSGTIRRTFRFLLFHGSTWSLGRARRAGQGCAFPCFKRFLLHQCGRVDG